MKDAFILFLFVLSSIYVSCDRVKPDSPDFSESGIRRSPIAISSIRLNQSYVKVVYGQPYRDGRTIFGDWEPYGEVWRTGANEATEITITKTILMDGNQILPGTYSLFTIPNEDSWTIILNRELGLWGAFDYKPEMDYLRFDIPTVELKEEVEVFTISFTELQNSVSTMSMQWDMTGVEIPIRLFEE